jgi:hypothetical protein
MAENQRNLADLEAEMQKMRMQWRGKHLQVIAVDID